MRSRHVYTIVGLAFVLAAAGPVWPAGQVREVSSGEDGASTHRSRLEWEFETARQLQDWTWRNLSGRSSLRVSGGRAVISVAPKEDLWSRDKREAPVLYLNDPVTGDFELRVVCNIRGRGPHSGGLILWAGRERISSFILLSIANDGNRACVGAEGCCSLGAEYRSPRIGVARGTVELRITRTGQRYGCSFRPAGSPDWRQVCAPEVTDAFRSVGVYAKTWGDNSAVALFDIVTLEEDAAAQAPRWPARDSSHHADLVRCVRFSPDGQMLSRFSRTPALPALP